MKTTIDIPDDILRKANVYAAQQNTTLTDLIVQGLSAVIDTATPGGRFRRENARHLIEALQAGNTEPIRPLTRDEIYSRERSDEGNGP